MGELMTDEIPQDVRELAQQKARSWLDEYGVSIHPFLLCELLLADRSRRPVSSTRATARDLAKSIRSLAQEKR